MSAVQRGAEVIPDTGSSTMAPFFSLTRAAWIPYAITWDPETGAFRGVEGPRGGGGETVLEPLDKGGECVLKTFPIMLAALCWLTIPAVAAAESWILWESVEEHRLHPVDSPFPSQTACVSRGQARITQYRQQFKPPRPGAVVEAVDGGLTARVRWQETSDDFRVLAERTAEYKESLKSVLLFQEAELKRVTERVEIRQGSGLSETDGERRDALRALVVAAQNRVDETRRRMAEADKTFAEANRQKPITRSFAAPALRYQCWPVGVNPQ